MEVIALYPNILFFIAIGLFILLYKFKSLLTLLVLGTFTIVIMQALTVNVINASEFILWQYQIFDRQIQETTTSSGTTTYTYTTFTNTINQSLSIEVGLSIIILMWIFIGMRFLIFFQKMREKVQDKEG